MSSTTSESSSTTAAFTPYLTYVFESVGTELVIFGMTVLVGYLLRLMPQRKPQLVKKGKIVEGGPQTHTNKKLSDACELDTSEGESCARGCSPRRVAQSVEAPKKEWQQAPKKERQLPPRREWKGSGPDPRDLLDEIAKMMRARMRDPTNRIATQAVMLYEELRQALKEGDMKFDEAAEQLGGSALEFFTPLVNCTIRAQKPELVVTMIDDMKEFGVARTLTFFETTMKQLAGQKYYQIALAIYDRLAADNLQPSVVTYSCLINFAAETSEFERAIEFYDKLRQITVPSVRACMTVLRVHARRQDWAASLAIFRDLESRGGQVDSLLLNIVLNTGISTNNLEAARELLVESQAKSPSLVDQVSYNTILKACAQRNDAQACLGMLEEMQAHDIAPTAITFNTCMDAAVRATRIDLAWNFAEKMRSSKLGPDKFSCSILVKGLARQPSTEHLEASLALLLEVDSACDMSLKSCMYHQILDTASKLKSQSAGTATASNAQALFTKAFKQMREQAGATPTSMPRCTEHGAPARGFRKKY